MIHYNTIMVKIDPATPVMLIDTSYFIFYRYFAVYNWFKLAKQTSLEVSTILSNMDFMNKFKKLFEDNLNKLCKNHQVQHANVVFVKDCMRDAIWRNQHYHQYKKSREERLPTFNGEIFKYCYSVLLPSLEARLGVQSCEHPRAEADDVIAVFARYIHTQHLNAKVVVVTNDNDYLQLINANTSVVNMKNLDLSTRLTNSPELYLKMKIIMGDKSDNIPSVFPKCGDKRALLLAMDDATLEEKLSKSEEFKQRYELNKLLIDMSLIPSEIQEEIRQMLWFVQH